ncbi:EEF1A lysine methyltransferase 2 isoform X1 [Capsicum annuum]|uniref:EEF1A lysine methyltransferase 2 isoform X1 n=1 Tax=Capsicum annuum TaxID=4072 RepID=UPI001FB14C46|nr:EEF1A lysine methyltransferase 2 isoform X1 [Capsicum annuum]
MVGMRVLPEDSDVTPSRTLAATDLISDDDRSVAADSWSIKSEYGSTLDDEQRHADATEALAAVNCRAASDYSSDKEEQDGEGVSSMLGFQSYWDSAYADELANYHEHGHAGEVWFGADVMEIVASWTKALCTGICQNHLSNHVGDGEPVGLPQKDSADWSVLDIGTGNGLLLQEFAKQGVRIISKSFKIWNQILEEKRFSNLTGTDYSEGAIDLARRLADRDNFTNIKFLVDDILETKLDTMFRLVLDKGTLDAIGLHPDGPIKRIMYWDSLSRIVAPGGLLVITSCNSTKDELVEEVETLNQRRIAVGNQEASTDSPPFRYLDHVRTYPTFTFGGSVGSRVATVAFIRN